MRRAYASLRLSLTGFSAADRSRAATRTLQSLGHMIHHLQDMAQPQHTRNEGHLHGKAWYPGEVVGAYEIYTKRANGTIAAIVQGNAYPAIPSANIPTARHLWHTPGASTPAYTGMAEFTAKNFPSYSKSFIVSPPTGVTNHPEHPLPNGTNVDGTARRVVPEVFSERLKSGRTLAGTRNYVFGHVFDGYTGLMYRDRRLGIVSLTGDVTEDKRVFDDRHQLLLPRAVAFSTALIDYFFRGRIALERPTSGNQWTIRNSGAFLLDGRVKVYTENAAGERYSPPTGAIFYVTLLPNATRTVSFTLPDDAHKVIAVFEGRIGNEGDTGIDENAVAPLFNHVAGDTVDAPPVPTVVLASNSLALPATGAVAGVGVTLSSMPRRDETVGVTRQSGSASISATPTQLTFTTANYQTPQYVNLAGLANPSSAQVATFTVGSDRLGFVTLNASQPVVSIPCGVPISATGGTTGYTKTMDLGSITGAVQVQFEAYSIPDSLLVTRSGSTVVSSGGMVSGLRNYSFPQSAGAPRYIDVRVTGNSDPNTQWTLAVSCPGGSVTPPRPQVQVFFGTDPGTLCGVSCSTLQVCGRYSVRVNGQSATTFSGGSTQLTAGTNVLMDVSHDSPNCGSGLATPTSSRGRLYVSGWASHLEQGK